MILFGTLVNVITVLIGGFIGSFFQRKLPEKYIGVIFQALGLFTCFIGIKMALNFEALIIVVFSLLLGGLLGTYLDLEGKVSQFSNAIKRRFKQEKRTQFTEGLVAAFLLFCVGSLTILGALEEGLNRNSELLLTKALMDGFSAIALSAALGRGVLFSVIPLFLYQAGLTLLAVYLKPFLLPEVISAITACGGILLLGLGLQLLNIRQFALLNFLPALLFAAGFAYFFTY
ncbi:MAG: DUF554 domain-containing protein [Luteibaculaceae bacterium]